MEDFVDQTFKLFLQQIHASDPPICVLLRSSAINGSGMLYWTQKTITDQNKVCDGAISFIQRLSKFD